MKNFFYFFSHSFYFKHTQFAQNTEMDSLLNVLKTPPPKGVMLDTVEIKTLNELVWKYRNAIELDKAIDYDKKEVKTVEKIAEPMRYADQFGGEKEKKLKYSQLKKLFINNKGKSMAEQNKLLKKTFETWRGNLKQVDDICVMGVRI